MEQSAPLLVLLWPLLFWASASVAEDRGNAGRVPVEVNAVVAKYCGDCHGIDTAEADIRFDGLASWNVGDHLKLLNAAEEQLLFGLMPPDDAAQPSVEERGLLAKWLQIGRAHV